MFQRQLHSNTLLFATGLVICALSILHNVSWYSDYFPHSYHVKQNESSMVRGSNNGRNNEKSSTLTNSVKRKGISAYTNKTIRTKRTLEALQPTNYDGCCIPAFVGGGADNCEGACFDERACHNPLYPYRSEEEMEMYSIAKYTRELDKMLEQQCNSPRKLQPPVQWCQKYPNDNVEVSTNEPLQLIKDIPPMGCSTVRNGGAFQRAIIFPQAKLVFCGIPKVGVTQWMQLLRFTLGAKDYPSNPHHKIDALLFHFDQLAPEVQRDIWNDDEWTFAAFVRDPAECLLSSYLDKIHNETGEFRFYDWVREQELDTFEKFVDSLSKNFNGKSCEGGKMDGRIEGLSWCSDPHWLPQVYTCGMSERLDRINFLGDMSHIATHSKSFLERVGLWESHGKHFIQGGVGKRKCRVASHPANHTVGVGFQQAGKMRKASAAETLAYKHAKGSKSKMEEYYTPEMLRRVQEDLYPHDYQLWKLVNANGEALSNGKELAHQLSDHCRK